MAPDTQFEPRFVPAFERHGFVSVTRTFGTLPEGGVWENYIVSVVTVARDRIARIELFEVEALEAALARFEELLATGATSSTGPLEPRRHASSSGP